MAATRIEVLPYKVTMHPGRFRDFGTSFVFRTGINADISERWMERMERMEGNRRLSKTVGNRVPIYQGVHEDELDSRGETVEVSPLRKYPILPARQKRLRRITAMEWRDLFYEGTSSPYASQERSFTAGIDENAILIMWPIRGHRVALGRRLPLPSDHRVDER